MKNYPIRYALVRHTGYSVGGKESFRNAVELRSFRLNEAKLDVLREAGVTVFDDYAEGIKKEEEYNYPASATGIIPVAQGKFVTLSDREFNEEFFIPLETRCRQILDRLIEMTEEADLYEND